MFCAVVSAGCGGGGGSDSPDPEQTESLTDDTGTDSDQTESLNDDTGGDTGSYAPNEEGRGATGNVVDVSTFNDPDRDGKSIWYYQAHDGDILTGTLTNQVKVAIANGATVTIRDLNIKPNPKNSIASFNFAGLNCEGNATIILEGTNYVMSFYQRYPGIHVPEGYTLTIKGDGELTALSHPSSYGGTGYGAGIGGGQWSVSSGKIVIDSGKITAIGGEYAAGIGGGYMRTCDDIVINGGTITAIGGVRAAGIGAGCGIGCGNITINGGNITTTGGWKGAGIGGSELGSCGNITINGGTIDASVGKKGAGIGSGQDGSCGDVIINGGTITATGGDEGGAAIGSGLRGNCGSVNITSGKVTATKGKEAPDTIGSGKDGKCGTVTIRGIVGVITKSPYTYNVIDLSKVTSDYTANDADILTGTLGANVKLSIADGATVTLSDVTINGVNTLSCKWAGISCLGDATLILDGSNSVKGFYDSYPGINVPEHKTLTIKGSGSLDASSNGYGAGIGGGWEVSCGNIVIDGGTITASGGWFAAGIGSAVISSCGTITITKNVTKVTATRGAYAKNSIGLGCANSACGTVTIGGKVGDISQSPYTYEP